MRRGLQGSEVGGVWLDGGEVGGVRLHALGIHALPSARPLTKGRPLHYHPHTALPHSSQWQNQKHVMTCNTRMTSCNVTLTTVRCRCQENKTGPAEVEVLRSVVDFRPEGNNATKGEFGDDRL